MAVNMLLVLPKEENMLMFWQKPENFHRDGLMLTPKDRIVYKKMLKHEHDGRVDIVEATVEEEDTEAT